MGFLPLPGSGPGQISSARVHPLVIFNICDSYIRRQEGQERVIGTLLGSIGVDGVVEVKNSYAVPHNENGGQVYVDVEFHRALNELHQRVNPKEVIVGWYSTGDGVVPTDALIHEFYKGESASSVHVTLDVNFANKGNLVRAWTGTTLSLGPPAEDKTPTAMHFQELGVECQFQEAERVGLDLLKKTETDKITSEAEGLDETVEKIGAMLDEALAYVGDVCEGKVPGDAEIGRYLSECIQAVPRLTKDQFEKLFGDSIQDVLLVMYLSNITKMQLMLAEKLGTVSLPI